MNSLDFSVSSYLLFCCLVASLSSFSSGFNFGSLTIIENAIRCPDNEELDELLPSCIKLDAQQFTLIQSAYALGGFFGGLYASRVCDRIGRLKAFALNNLFFIFGSMLLIFITEPIQFLIGRLMVGVGSGGSSVLLSTYLAELASKNWRGRLGFLLQIMFVVGMLTSQVLGLVLSSWWRIIFALSLLGPLIQFILIPFCLESSPYLILNKQYEQAKNNLQKIRPLYSIEEEYELQMKWTQPIERSTLLELWSNLKMRKFLFFVIMLHLAQQFSGINLILLYSKTLLKKAFGDISNLITLGTTAVLLTGSLASFILVDFVGRKILLITGLGLQLLSYVLITLGLYYDIHLLTALSTFFAVFFFAVGIGSIPWMIMGDLFPSTTLATANSISVSLNWLSNFVINFLSIPILISLKNFTFVLFSSILALVLLLTLFFSDSRQKTLDQIYGVKSPRINSLRIEKENLK